MNRFKVVRKLKNNIALLFFLSILVMVFYLLSYAYSMSSRNSKTIVLDSDLLKSSFTNHKHESLKLENASKIDTEYSILGPNILNNNLIMFMIFGKNGGGNIYTLNVDSKRLAEVIKGNEPMAYNFILSEGGGKMIYSAVNKIKGSQKVYVYDVVTGRRTEIIEKGPFVDFIIDNGRYIGINNDYLFVNDLMTGKRECSISRNKIDKAINIKNAKKSKFKCIYELQTAKDNNILYLMWREPSASAIIQMNLKAKKVVRIPIKAEIYSYKPLNNGNLIFSGSALGTKGIFIYNIKTKRVKNIKQGNINTMEVTEDNKKIAYIIPNGTGINEVHAATLYNGKIESDITAYSSYKYGIDLRWNKSGNKLFYFISYGNVSTVYRFSIKN